VWIPGVPDVVRVWVEFTYFKILHEMNINSVDIFRIIKPI